MNHLYNRPFNIPVPKFDPYLYVGKPVKELTDALEGKREFQYRILNANSVYIVTFGNIILYIFCNKDKIVTRITNG